jgi:hypothetical protein
MPIRAIADGSSYIAPLMTDIEWSRMRQEVNAKRLRLSMPCCGAVGFPRESHNGLRHFYHRGTISCDWKPETPHHITIKGEIALACQLINYSATPEFRGPDWRADILITPKDSAEPKLAFEIQWSPQTLETTRERQGRYIAAGVKCFWLFRKMPKPLDRGAPPWQDRYVGPGRNPLPESWTSDSNYLKEERLPIFLLVEEGGDYFVKMGVGLRRLPLRDFVHHVVHGRIAFRPLLRILQEDSDLITDEDFEFYDSRCGTPQTHGESITRWNHWCFAENGNFCPHD